MVPGLTVPTGPVEELLQAMTSSIADLTKKDAAPHSGCSPKRLISLSKPHPKVVIPWYRPCQMERTSRWEAGVGPWDRCQLM